jgi:hypothetical protein
MFQTSAGVEKLARVSFMNTSLENELQGNVCQRDYAFKSIMIAARRFERWQGKNANRRTPIQVVLVSV